MLDSNGCLVDDDGRVLSPPLRPWWTPEPGKPWAYKDLLLLWAVDGRDGRDGLARGSSLVKAALEADERAGKLGSALRRGRSDPRFPSAKIDRLERRYKAAVHKRRGRFDLLLETGLRIRLGSPLDLGAGLELPAALLPNWLRPETPRMHRIAFDRIRERASPDTMPSGIAVCECCSLVFEPNRKLHAYRCDPCHASKGGRVPLSTTGNGTGGYDLAGFHGELMVRTKECEECGEPFETRSHGRFCCEAHRKQFARRAEGT